MTVANSLLLRHLANATNLQDLITVHNAAASNASGTIYSPRVTMGTEFATATSRANGAADRVDQVTVDAFLSSHQLPRVIDVCTVDAEGHDPLVLEGMSAALRDKRVTLLEFEYHSKGFWSPKLGRAAPCSRSRRCSTKWATDATWRAHLQFTCLSPKGVGVPLLRDISGATSSAHIMTKSEPSSTRRHGKHSTGGRPAGSISLLVRMCGRRGSLSK